MKVKEFIKLLNTFDGDLYVTAETIYYDSDEGRQVLNFDIDSVIQEDKHITLRGND